MCWSNADPINHPKNHQYINEVAKSISKWYGLLLGSYFTTSNHILLGPFPSFDDPAASRKSTACIVQITPYYRWLCNMHIGSCSHDMYIFVCIYIYIERCVYIIVHTWLIHCIPTTAFLRHPTAIFQWYDPQASLFLTSATGGGCGVVLRLRLTLGRSHRSWPVGSVMAGSHKLALDSSDFRICVCWFLFNLCGWSCQVP